MSQTSSSSKIFPQVRPVGCQVYFLPMDLRMPLKFGHEVVTHLTACRVRLTVEDHHGKQHDGWGETPLSANWAWPSKLTHETRLEAMKAFAGRLCEAWANTQESGHAMDVGHAFLQQHLPALLKAFNRDQVQTLSGEAMPTLAALVTLSAFDIALHDAFGKAVGLPVYETYDARYMPHDLSHYLSPAADSAVCFEKLYPADFLKPRREKLTAWHLVGGLDPLTDHDLTTASPKDNHPVTLESWIKADQLKALKIKLKGNDAAWDYDRIIQVGGIALAQNVDWLTTDFNCTAPDAAYVNAILDRLRDEQPRLYGMLLYVEQPFPYELPEHPIDVHSVSARKPLFMDESAHDWQMVKLGRSLGWTGVALKTCKTQTGALLTLCWARAHGMTLMVQDLTNVMLAQIPHVLLAAHADTICGVESNGMQFCPDASQSEAAIHPGLYRRQGGKLDLSTLNGAGMGYRAESIGRDLPPPAYRSGVR